jgi:hypothetical protein
MTKYIFILLFISAFAHANEDSAYAEVARLRQYAGGADESDLAVQKNLNQVKTKKKKQSKPEPAEGF